MGQRTSGALGAEEQGPKMTVALVLILPLFALYFLLLLYVPGGFSACMYVWAPDACLKSYQITWNWSLKQLRATIEVLGTKPESPPSALNGRFISSAPLFFTLKDRVSSCSPGCL